MCGIVAVLGPRPLSMAVLERMRDRLAHRGPDGRGAWTERVGDGAVGLAHRRLSIIDLSPAAGQPMTSDDDRHVVTCNGEIYNYPELREELIARGRTFRTKSDTEVLLAAYATWGEECLTRLNGMFAFALWDRPRRRLLVARDRFGEKPLFLARLPSGGVALASEMKALFAHPEVPAVPDDRVIARYVAGQYYEDDTATFFRGVERVPPAHALLIDADGAVRRQWRYWTPDYTAVRPGYREADAVAELRTRLERSVRMRLRADVAVGSSLSGGLDSSMIVGLLAGLRDRGAPSTLHAFSARFDDDPTLSEGPEIDTMVRHTGVEAFSVSPHPDGLMAECRLLHWHQEEPFLSASIYLQWCVMRLARARATTVLLDGQGADELLAGYQFYFRTYQLDCLDRRAWATLVRDTVAFRRRLRRAFAAFPDGRRRFDPDIALGLWGLLARGAVQTAATGDTRAGVPAGAPGMRLRRQLALALQYDSLPMLLRYADRNAMAFGRETRFPYLDHELVDWCLGLPDRALIREGWQKYLLRRAGTGLIPPQIQWRADKVGYAAPLDVWLRGPLAAWAQSRLFSGPLVEVPGYDRPRLLGMWERHRTGLENLSWPLWRWISLGEWLALGESGAWSTDGAPC